MTTTADHVQVTRKYAPDSKLDIVIVDPTVIDDIDGLTVTVEELEARALLC